MKKYLINYIDVGISQVKNLIPHNEYLYSKSLLLNELNRTDIKEKEKDINIGKKYLKQYGDFFTDNSPLYNSISSGILDYNNQKIKVNIVEI